VRPDDLSDLKQELRQNHFHSIKHFQDRYPWLSSQLLQIDEVNIDTLDYQLDDIEDPNIRQLVEIYQLYKKGRIDRVDKLLFSFNSSNLDPLFRISYFLIKNQIQKILNNVQYFESIVEKLLTIAQELDIPYYTAKVKTISISILRYQNKVDEAIVEYEQLLAELDDYPDLKQKIRHNLVNSYQVYARYDQALQVISEMIPDAGVLMQSATILTELGLYDQAIYQLTRAEELVDDEDFILNFIYLLKAMSFLRLYDDKSAEKYLDLIDVSTRDDMNLHLKKYWAEIFRLRGDIRQSQELIDDLLVQFDERNDNINYAETYVIKLKLSIILKKDQEVISDEVKTLIAYIDQIEEIVKRVQLVIFTLRYMDEPKFVQVAEELFDYLEPLYQSNSTLLSAFEPQVIFKKAQIMGLHSMYQEKITFLIQANDLLTDNNIYYHMKIALELVSTRIRLGMYNKASITIAESYRTAKNYNLHLFKVYLLYYQIIIMMGEENLENVESTLDELATVIEETNYTVSANIYRIAKSLYYTTHDRLAIKFKALSLIEEPLNDPQLHSMFKVIAYLIRISCNIEELILRNEVNHITYEEIKTDLFSMADIVADDTPMLADIKEIVELMDKLDHTNETEVIDGIQAELYELITTLYRTYVHLTLVSRSTSSWIYDEIKRQEHSKVVGQVISSVSHEFNNIISITNLELALLRGNLEKINQTGAITRIDKIETATMKMSNLITNMNKLANNEVIETSVINLSDTMKRILSLVSTRIHKTIKVIQKIEDDRIQIRANDFYINQIVMNLLLNATEAMNRGEIQVEVAKQVDHAVLLISDNGSGMDPLTLNQIFKPYFTTKSTGIGLGLYNVKKSVDALNASIEVESDLGVGTRFRVEIPLAD